MDENEEHGKQAGRQGEGEWEGGRRREKGGGEDKPSKSAKGGHEKIIKVCHIQKAQLATRIRHVRQRCL